MNSSIRLVVVETRRLPCDHACGAHHIHDAGSEADHQEDHEPPGRRRQETVDTPAKKRSNEDPGNEFGREAQPDGHGGCLGPCRLLHLSGLLLLQFTAAPTFGEPLTESVQPCRERGLVGRRLVVCLIFAKSAVSCVLHVIDTRSKALTRKEKSSATLKSRADHTDRAMPSQDSRNAQQIADFAGLIARYTAWLRTLVTAFFGFRDRGVLAPPAWLCWDARVPGMQR